EGSKPLFAAVWKAHRDFKANFRTMKDRRKAEIQACRKKPGHQPNRTGRYKGSILIDYFIRGKQTFDQLDTNRFWK
ncbi:MAG: hypothetical protein ACPG08_05725, partial [Flavobacteriales bacterium]